MIGRLAALFLLAAAGPSLATPLAPVTEQVRSEADGTSSLSHVVVVPASPDEVWAAITTVEGWKSWAVPVAWISADRPQVIETSYNPAASPGGAMNIENEFLERVPPRRLVFRTIKAPKDFPHFEALRRVTQTFELATEADGTRVSLTGTGYGSDEAGLAVLAFFRAGNRISLTMLRERFTNGPVDWSEKLRKPLK